MPFWPSAQAWAIYLSGGGVAAGSLNRLTWASTPMDDVFDRPRRITDVCDLPLLVDIDTGFGPSAFNIERTVKSLIKAALLPATLKTRWAPSAAAIAPVRKSCPPKKWWTAREGCG